MVDRTKMAAPMTTHVRIKVYFENNEFDASWLLIDTSELRTMKDVQRYISLRFLGKTVPLYLTLQGCFLPDWEKSVILRDNDCINAKCIHQDSFENQTMLLNSAVAIDGDTNTYKVHKKKKKKEKTQLKLTSDKSESQDGEYCNELRNNNLETDGNCIERDGVVASTSKQDSVAMETSPVKQKLQKRKHELDNESDKRKEKKKKRKLEKKEDQIELEEVQSIDELQPSSKKLEVDRPATDTEDQEFVKCESNIKYNCDNLENEINIGVDQDKEDNKNDNNDDNKGEGKKRNRRRKRVRKRKRKSDEPVTDKSLLETPKMNSKDSCWNWHTGKESVTYAESDRNVNSKHRVFQSNSDDSDSDSAKNKSQNNSAMYSETTHVDSTYYSPASIHSKSHSSDKKNAKEQSKSFTTSTNQVIDQPSILSTSYLTNGVAVYSRSRGKQQHNLKQYAELTKEEQLNTKLTNVSVILQNDSYNEDRKTDSETEKEIAAIYQAVPIDKNYSKFPALIGPPRVGDRLVYKVIELSETYTPEVSDYKEAVVCSYNPQTTIVELDNIHTDNRSRRHDGKFEVEFDEDEEDISTETADAKVCLPLESLLEPKLLS